MYRRPARRSARRTSRRTARRTSRRTSRRVARRVRRRTVFVGGMMVLAASGTAAAIKLSQQDAQKIEQHTGLSPDQLEDQDLNQAMQELNIQSQPLTPEEQASLDQQDSPMAPPTPTSSKQPDYIAELEKLGELKSMGIITDEEFEAKKKQLLGL
ncbi:MAG: SHOCT domain-containing protein [Chloroflexota bacterium]|nr:SHOCT domain-containing protein [Chloroflexota bacterium]